MKSKKKILIIEDEEQLLTILSFKLELSGFIVLKARNGVEGYELALLNHPDLVLLDMMMPVMDGMKMLKTLRMDSWGKYANVIVLTNLAAEHEKEVLALGVQKYLVKSDWSLEDIMQLVKDTCGAQDKA